ncbi:MAG: NCS2 family permease [Treponema sp.]|nr:NCS2 family permease [Treponema sp.]
MDKFFKISERNSSFGKEIIGGITTFLAMAYILAVNPSILSGAGLELPAGTLPTWGGVFTATAVSAAIATLVMGFIANLPIVLAPGLGLNAFFSFTVVLEMGCTWQLALTAVLLEGLLFICLSLCGLREALIKAFPETLKKSVAIGIGLFITLIGLANAGIITTETATTLAFVNFDMAHKTALVATIGLIITIILFMLKIRGSVLLAIAITTIIGIPFGVTKIPEGFRPFSLPAAPHLFCFDFAGIAIDPATHKFSAIIFSQFFVIFFTFLFMDFFDTLGTLIGVAEQADLIEEDGSITNGKEALLADSIGTVAGACLGTSTVTSFIESTSGIAAGARTGFSSIVAAVMFLLALFISPVFALIPAAATAPALIFVGYMMMKNLTEINFKDPSEGIPAFITMIALPFSYSISNGIVWGVLSYCICKIAAGKAKEINIITWVLAVLFGANMIFQACRHF